QKTVAGVSVTVAVLSAFGYLALIPPLGGTGAAIVMASAVSASNLWLYVVVRRRFGFRLYGFV
ncbi:MAG: hypothetical protein ACRD3Q_21945, partial [Terriglobales bacterium]